MQFNSQKHSLSKRENISDFTKVNRNTCKPRKCVRCKSVRNFTLCELVMSLDNFPNGVHRLPILGHTIHPKEDGGQIGGGGGKEVRQRKRASVSLRLLLPLRGRMFHQVLQILCFLLLFKKAFASSQLDVTTASGVSDGSAKLRCLATQHKPGLTPTLVLWYRNGARKPFYTLDLRSGGDGEPKEYVPHAYSRRITSSPTGSWLQLTSLADTDAGLYKCRVDFQNAPTLSALVNLTVFELPSQLVIQDANRNPVINGLLGPMMEGNKLSIFCVSSGGNPPPRVTWWSGDILLADKSYVLGRDGTMLSSHELGVAYINSPPINFDESKKVPGFGFRDGSEKPYVITELFVPKLNKDHAALNITCNASNNNITLPLQQSVTLTVYLHPKRVVISSLSSEKMQENKTSRLECVAEGSIPAANISWSKSVGGRIENLHSTSQVVDGRTISKIKFTPRASDHGATLVCHAFNPRMDGDGKKTSVILNVQFSPRVNLHLGTNLVGRPITENEDVYFDCEVQCNPQHKRIVWMKENEVVTQNLKKGILVSDKNLVLQRVHRTSAGNYTCTVTNEMGTATSKPAELSVRFLPVCGDEPLTIAIGEGETSNLRCRVEAHPIDQLRFTWFFNNTLDTIEVEDNRVSIEGDHSVLNYTPESARDYGTLSCWATNVVGTQAEPCRFTVIEAGPPESVRNCELVNHTVGALEVFCSPGGNGGSPQKFEAKVFTSPTNMELAVMESPYPKFHVEGLDPGQDYLVTITAINDKGSSEPVQIDAIRLKVAEKRMGEINSPALSPLLGVFIGLVGGFVVLILVAVVITRRARTQGSCSCLQQTSDINESVLPSGGANHSTDMKNKILESSGDMLYQEKSSLHMGSSNDMQLTPRLYADRMNPLQTYRNHSSPDDEDDEEGPDLVRISNETSQLLGFGKCPELLQSKRPPSYLESTKGMITPTQVLSQASSPGLSQQDPYAETPSPHRLPHDESFV